MRARAWCFTLNNYSDEEVEELRAVECEYMIAGDEVGENETPHIQGYARWGTVKSFDQIKKMLGERCHLESARGSPQQNVDYCSKESVLFELGERPKMGRRSDLAAVRGVLEDTGRIRDVVAVATSVQSIRCAEILVKYVERTRDWQPEVFWFWGPTGSGKTRTAFAAAVDPWVSAGSLRWFCGYDAHEDVILDDFRAEHCSFTFLLRLLDRYAFRVETKGGSRQFLAKRVWITSPYAPDKMPWGAEDVNQLVRRLAEIREFTAE